MNLQKIKNSVQAYYTQKLVLHGSTAQGVDWKTEASQFLRFEQILKICDFHSKFSLMDLGCGYGALFGYARRKTKKIRYLGFDLSPQMIDKARERNRRWPGARFKIGMPIVEKADYAVSSGIFNVKLDTPGKEWKAYILRMLQTMDLCSRKGFSFNCLTSYSDKEKMRPDLYYGDPLFFFDYCKKKFSKNVALLHDYGLYEFTILVRK